MRRRSAHGGSVFYAVERELSFLIGRKRVFALGALFAFGLVALLPQMACAAPAVPSVNIGIGQANGPQDVSVTLQIMALLTAKKAAKREFAAAVLEKSCPDAFREAVQKAFEAEKTAALKARFAAILGEAVPEEAASEVKEDLVVSLTKGSKAKKVAWLFENPFPPVRMADGSEAPENHLQALTLAYASMNPPARNTAADSLAAALHQNDLEKFAQAVFGRWLNAGAAAKTKWVLYLAAIHGGMDAQAVLLKYIKEWSENSRGAIACEAVNALAMNGSSAALMAVDQMARKFKKRQVKEAAGQALQTAAEALGGAWADAFRFMDRYGLYDISQAPEKEDISYQTYLYSYEAPMLIVNSVGDSSDFTAFAHEFGHFTEAYYTYAASEDLETAETYSQATEFLALCYTTSLSDREREQMLRLKLLDALETFLSQASYARFEERVYALPESELTVDRVNEISREVNRDYGYYDPEYDNYYTLGWIEVTHFFSNPFYVISYCVSADTSLQVYQLEAAEPGAGVKAFEALLDRGYAYGVKEVMKNAGLENPFSPGRMKTLADFFRQELLR